MRKGLALAALVSMTLVSSFFARTAASADEWITLSPNVQIIATGASTLLVAWDQKSIAEVPGKDVQSTPDGKVQIKVGSSPQWRAVRGASIAAPMAPMMPPHGKENQKASCIWFALTCCGSGRIVKAGPDIANGPCGNGTERYEPTCDHDY